MRVLITGAAGFVGATTVRVATERGHEVRALVRPSTSDAVLKERFGPLPVEVVRSDLRSGSSLRAALAGVDSVIHLAAAKKGDFSTQFASTVRGTEHLLAEMVLHGVPNLVGVSTLAVYDYREIESGALLTEQSPLERAPSGRSAYARTKLAQEKLMAAFGESVDSHTAVVRPGMVYGPDHLWNPLLGIAVGDRYVRIGASRTLPMIYVEHCGDALVIAAEQLTNSPESLRDRPLNLVDNDLPTCGEFSARIEPDTLPSRFADLPWAAMRAIVSAVGYASGSSAGKGARLPDVLTPGELHARFKPLQFSNERARTLLDWEPRYHWTEALEKCWPVR